jgi:hypothetical protein
MSLNPDKRALKRHHLIYYLRVIDRSTQEQLGHLVDITPDGIMLIVEKPLPVDVDYQLQIALPQEINGKEWLDLDARAIWCRPDVNPSLFGMGFQISEVTPEDTRRIMKTIQEFGFQD